MRVMMVRAKIKADSIDEIEAQGRKLFSEIEDGADNPLLALPAAREFQEKLNSWLAEPATSQQLTVLGSYRLF
jgi:hypothetical protein